MTSEPGRDVASWRQEYEDRGLTESDLGDDPITAFGSWLAAARKAGLHEPNAMVLSTRGTDHGASSRMVLLKTVDRRGFVFYTNLESAKGTELRADPCCALLFPWYPLERQVRVEGVASAVDDAEADAYFASRPRGAQIGAWASPQSRPVGGRDELEAAYASVTERFVSTAAVPRPTHWSGFLVRPTMIEFWQGRPGRMHDRIRFERLDGDRWQTSRLAP